MENKRKKQLKKDDLKNIYQSLINAYLKKIDETSIVRYKDNLINDLKTLELKLKEYISLEEKINSCNSDEEFNNYLKYISEHYIIVEDFKINLTNISNKLNIISKEGK